MKAKQSSILSLTGEELQKELDSIITSNPPPLRKWSNKEVEILTKLHGKVPNAVIARTLGRSLSSVNNMVPHIADLLYSD